MLDKYAQILENELSDFNIVFKNSLKTSLEKYDEVLNYIYSNKGKQIRPLLGILVAKNLGEFTDKQKKFLAAIECIHSATLFHDDVIDNSKIRRNNKALQEKFSNKIAILSGDYFLSVALKNIYEVQNNEINKISADFIKKICEGELEQNLTLYELISLEKYLEKTKNKTALLFELTTLGISILSDNNNYSEKLRLFGENIGIAFQIKDDLKNFMNFVGKPVLNDLESGVITAPVIFLAQENPNISKLLKDKKYSEIISLIKKSNALEKTQKLVDKYIDLAKENIASLPNNDYKNLVLELLSEF